MHPIYNITTIAAWAEVAHQTPVAFRIHDFGNRYSSDQTDKPLSTNPSVAARRKINTQLLKKSCFRLSSVIDLKNASYYMTSLIKPSWTTTPNAICISVLKCNPKRHCCAYGQGRQTPSNTVDAQDYAWNATCSAHWQPAGKAENNKRSSLRLTVT